MQTFVFCNTTNHNAKETIDNMLTNGQTDGHHQSRVFTFANQYALLWTPTCNAYRDMLMRILTPCLFFQCFFTNFQCVITLLRALSVALGCIILFYFFRSKVTQVKYYVHVHTILYVNRESKVNRLSVCIKCTLKIICITTLHVTH